MLRSESVIMIREKILEGKGAYAVGKELGFSKNTVKKYIDPKNADKCNYPTRSSKLDPYKNEIDKLMSNGVFNCVVILEHIAKLGYDGKITILKDYVAPFRPPKNIPAVRRYETLPGKQAQMDWGICQYTDVKGNVRKVSAFTMVLLPWLINILYNFFYYEDKFKESYKRITNIHKTPNNIPSRARQKAS